MLVLEVAVTKELGLQIVGETNHRCRAPGSRELICSAPWDVHTFADTNERLRDPTLRICEGIGQLAWSTLSATSFYVQAPSGQWHTYDY
jgi:hypothetical protein